MPDLVSHALSTGGATPRPSVTSIITALILEEYEMMTDELQGDKKKDSNKNLLQLLNLLASLNTEENKSSPTSETPTQNPPPVSGPAPRPTFQETVLPIPQKNQFPSRPVRRPFVTRPLKRPTFEETDLPVTQDDNLPSLPGPPYLPQRPPQFQRPVRRPSASEPPKNYRPPGGETSPSLLDQMLSDLLGTTVLEPSQPQRPYPKFPTVDVVIGGVPRPGPQTWRPSLASPARYPIRIPRPVREPGGAFSLPSDSIRPQRQFDVSTIQGAAVTEEIGPRNSLDGRAGFDVVNDSQLAAYYPQSLSWDSETTEGEEVDEVPRPSLGQVTQRPTTTGSRVGSIQPETETKPNHRVGNTDREVTSLKTGTAYEDNLEFQNLVAQLNSTLERLRTEEEDRQRRQRLRESQASQTHQQAEQDEGPELIYVNIWNNVEGKLQLAGQKPMTKDTFNEMQSKNDFSSLLTNNKEAAPRWPLGYPEQYGDNSPVGLSQPQGLYPAQGFPPPRSYQAPLQGNIELEEYVRRQGGQHLPIPSSIASLISSPPSSSSPPSVYPPNRSPWQPQSPGPQGVGADSAQPSYADTQGLQQDQLDLQRFLQNPTLAQRPFSQNQQTVRPPNFTPIPIPQVFCLLP